MRLVGAHSSSFKLWGVGSLLHMGTLCETKVDCMLGRHVFMVIILSITFLLQLLLNCKFGWHVYIHKRI